MKTFATICLLMAGLAGSAMSEESAPLAIPEKLQGLLQAKASDGSAILTEENQTYFNGLSDHLKQLFVDAVNQEIITSPKHLKQILSLNLRPQKIDLLMRDNCLLCHSDAEMQNAATLFSLDPAAHESPHYMNLKEVVEDVHFRRGVSCAGCHGGDASSPEVDHRFVKQWPATGRQKDRTWVTEFCARCHSDPTFMNQFNPALPTDQLAKFKDSPHGKFLLEQKDMRAPQCVSCHGNHGIRDAKNPLSQTHPKRVPETCGSCHSSAAIMTGIVGSDGKPLPVNQEAEFRSSVHGKALLERGDRGAPSCNGCHGSHAAMPVGVARVSQSCSLCHAGNASLFDGSKHKQAFDRHQWPECATCHGNHAVAKTHDGMLNTRTHALCVDCHREYAKDNPECAATTAYFHQTISSLAASLHRFSEESDKLAAKGLDVEAIAGQVGELNDTLKQVRSYVHSFDRNTFQTVAERGEKTVQTLAGLVGGAEEEYSTRQRGLAGAIALMGLLMLLLYLKLRQMEKAERGGGR